MLTEDRIDSSIVGSRLAALLLGYSSLSAGATGRHAVAAITGLGCKRKHRWYIGYPLRRLLSVAEDGVRNIWRLAWHSQLTVSAPTLSWYSTSCALRALQQWVLSSREMNNAKWTWFAIGYQCALAYVVALCINQIGGLSYRQRKRYRFNRGNSGNRIHSLYAL